MKYAESLIQFAEQHYTQTLYDRNEKGYELNVMMRAYEHISTVSGIRNLGCKHGFIPKGGSVPPEWVALYDGDYDDILDDDEIEAIPIDKVHVLSVCSDDEQSFEEHPIQEQVDYMTKLIRQGPQW